MKTVTKTTEICNITNQKITSIFLNGEKIFILTPCRGLKDGYASNAKFCVRNVQNSFGISWWSSTTKSIKNLLERTIK